MSEMSTKVHADVPFTLVWLISIKSVQKSSKFCKC